MTIPQDITAKSALDQSFLNMMESHGLLSFHVQILDYGDRLGFSLSSQWADEMQCDGRNIASGGGDTIAEAMGNMLVLMMAKRGAKALADEALPIGEAA